MYLSFILITSFIVCLSSKSIPILSNNTVYDILSCVLYFAESDMASFDRASYLFYKLDTVTSPSPKDLLTMNFKTLHNSGVLMHMAGNHGHNLSLELLKGKLFIHLRKGSLTLAQ